MKVWIRIEKEEEAKEVQDFILEQSMTLDGFLGKIPVRLCIGKHSVIPLGKIYNVSEDALVHLYKKYGEQNVKLAEAGCLLPESWWSDSRRSTNLLERIADALENISGTLKDVKQILAGATADEIIEFQDRKIKLLEKKISLMEELEVIRSKRSNEV